MPFAEIILPLSLPKTFTYRISDTDGPLLKPGMRVAVPFGKQKLYTGLVAEIHETPPVSYQAREIHQTLEALPSVSAVQLAHWQWVADYYMCSLGEVFRSAMPSALLLESETSISLHPDFSAAELLDDEYLIVEALRQQSELKVHDIVNILGKKTVLPVLRRLMAAGIVKLQEEFSERYTPKLVKYVRLFPEFESQEGLQQLLDLLRNADKQREAALAYFQLRAQSRKPVSAAQLAETAGVAPSVVKALADKGIFELYHCSMTAWHSAIRTMTCRSSALRRSRHSARSGQHSRAKMSCCSTA